MDHTPASGDTADALSEAARALLTRGNLLLQNECGALSLRAGVGQRHAATLACVQLDSAQGRLLIALEREQLNAPLGDAQWQDYVGEARLLAWSLAHEPLLDALGRVFGGGYVATRFFAAGADLACLWLKLDWQDDAGQSLQGWLGLGVAETCLLAACTAWKRDPSTLSLLGDATELGLELLLQGRPLTPAAVAALHTGDVLLLGDGAEGEALLQPDPHTARCMFGLPAGWTVQRRHGQWMIAARPLLASSVDAQRPHCRLARLTLSPHQVEALKPGSMLSYDTTLLGNPVEILLGGACIGSGVLVALGSWLGVRIGDDAPH
ncbi:FliM/FliN family flagellar motor switch protein [Dyella acidiphila]|uniref:FliM/FliN family flagellar motor switch protein n=1 Tax=Dyella acidiphila TaxID=2775866 RepID=A0ABR9GBK7_9GAMM|nr:FliM/FliN family flagellar motor switch protein [Dyella acidiphila]MBE1161417.1 FliM/FliN family flagellar motor switch protein [Dyella acidiphila]